MATATPQRPHRLRASPSVEITTTALPPFPKTHKSSEQLQNQPQPQSLQQEQPKGPSPRRSSFGFLKRTSESGKMTKKQKAQYNEELLRQQREAALLPKQPPRLPSVSPLPTINSFGGEDTVIATQHSKQFRRTPSQGSLHARTMNFSRVSPVPNPVRAPPTPDSDPYARTESMTHRGRYSYASSIATSINSPRRVRRRKDPVPFNILVIGAKNSGKTSFINFLKMALALPKGMRQQSPPHHVLADLGVDPPFKSDYIETDIDNERVGVTIWDSQGLEKNVVDLQLREMASFLETKFEETFTEEQKVVRSLGVWENYIHCAFLILDPVRLDSNLAAAARSDMAGVKGIGHKLVGVLDDDLDLEVLRTLQGKTTVIPVISKADSITTKHMARLKKLVWDSLKQAKLDPLEGLDLDESDEDALDERDEDEADSGEELVRGDSPTLKTPKENSSSDENEASSDKASTSPSSPPRPSPDGKRPGGHARKASAMSATIASSLSTTDTELPYLPMSIISPDIYEPEVIGRQFPWGFADPYNVEHCDFIRLKESIFREWRTELREASRGRWYENWRTSRLNRSATPQRRAQTGDASKKSPGSLMPLPNGNVRATSAGGMNSENIKPPYQPYRDGAQV